MHIKYQKNAHNLRRGKEYYTTVEPLLCAINCTEIKVVFFVTRTRQREAPGSTACSKDNA